MIRTLAMAAGLAIGASAAQAAFTGIAFVEGDSAGASSTLGQNAVTFQMYATFDGAGDGVVNTVLNTSFVDIAATNGMFYNDGLGNHQPPNGGFFPIVPTLQYDTYGTIGVITNDLPGGGAVSIEEGTNITSNAIVGGWFNSSPPNNIGAATAQDALGGGFGTLLFNITVIGANAEGGGDFNVLNYLAGSLSIFTQGNMQAIEHMVVIPTPAALSLFGIAGLAAARRRR